MSLTKTTLLDAVNILLSTIDQSPTSTLEGEVGVDVTRAVATVNETMRQVQSIGWEFNTEDNYTLIPDANTNEIKLSDNVLNVKSNDVSIQVVPRGSRLYNKTDSTYKFSTNITATVILGFQWDDLPEYARRYITIKAARKFQNRNEGSDTGARFTSQDEAEAFSDFKSAEMNHGQYNLLDPEWRD